MPLKLFGRHRSSKPADAGGRKHTPQHRAEVPAGTETPDSTKTPDGTAAEPGNARKRNGSKARREPRKTPFARSSSTAAAQPSPPAAGKLHTEPPPVGSNLAAHAINVSRHYGTGETVVRALDDISVAFDRGRFTAIMGPSGSGKSTLMHCLAGLDSVTSGTVRIGDLELNGLKDKELTALRRDRLGFVFQSFNLVPTLTAMENITLPLDIAGNKGDADWLTTVVTKLGLQDRLDHRPSELSGGQQQRVACARALVGRPEVVFGDEPTGNLDSHSSHEVLDILRTSVDDLEQTVVIVTHDPRAASTADRVIFLADGKLAGYMDDPTQESILDAMKQLES